MKRIMTLLLAAGMVFGAATGASAIDFNMKGQWLFGAGYADSAFVTKSGGKRTAAAASDKFQAIQRLRLQLNAVASESLSGTVFFEIGDTVWGNAKTGGALGTDGNIVEVKNAYIDWIVPNTDLKFRMGLQGMEFPNVAGGSAILADDAAGITASYRFNDMVSLTGVWVRPYNDNFTGNANYPANYLDNMDVFLLSLPLTGDGWKITPWASVGMQGKNTVFEGRYKSVNNAEAGLFPFTNSVPGSDHMGSMPYRTVFWAGLPMSFTALDPWNFELDLNYGSADSYYRYDVQNKKDGFNRRATSSRSGWLVKGLAEYKMDWGTPGLFAWYGSGDDDNVKNGSERMPTLSPGGNFTSFMGDGNERGWSIHDASWRNSGYDLMMNYSGTWGIGAQIKDLTFLEDLKHTLRVAYWGGTNNPGMTKYLNATDATYYVNEGGNAGVYLTTNDSLVEFNVDSTYKIYENLTATLELGYIINGIDKGTWGRYYQNTNFSKGDAVKAALIFNYSF